MEKQKSVFASLDWLTILIYLALLALGWMSICGACYEYGQPRDILSLASFDTRTGMQLVWIGSSIVLGTIVLLLDDRLFDTFAYLIYALLVVLLFITPFLAHDIKGSMSWIKIGPFSFQSAEFAKFATSLALAKFMGSYGFKLEGSWKNLSICMLLMLLPMGLIIMQKETGSALVYLSLFLMLYREGMPGSILFLGLSAITYVVVGLRFADEMVLGGSTSLGLILVMMMIVVFVIGMIISYARPSTLAASSVGEIRNASQTYRRALLSTAVLGLGSMVLLLLFAHVAFSPATPDPSTIPPELSALAADPSAVTADASIITPDPSTVTPDASADAADSTDITPDPSTSLLQPFDIGPLFLAICTLLILRLLWLGFTSHIYRYCLIAVFAIGSIGIFYSANYMLDHLKEHQRARVQELLGLREDPNGVGYNVIQAKIAIGSGGLEGKGFLQGTQTKLRYVPEQETDFIFCTMGEEQGFIGSAIVLLLFLALLLRLLFVAERQPYTFGRVYGYCVFSIFLFHVLINIGMVLGLMPVIGIPLPFFSYGGSSLWGFTLLLFIFLGIDAGRVRYQH